MTIETAILVCIGMILYFGIVNIVEILDKILIELKKLNNNEHKNK